MNQSRRQLERAVEARSPLLAALEALGGGAVVVLDSALRIVDATPAADALLGRPPRGVLAPKVFCGQSPQRPLADALMERRSVNAIIPSPTGDGQVRVHVRPLHHDGAPVGFMLLFDPVRGDEEAMEVGGLWTRTPSMKQTLHLLRKLATTDAPVLVCGESGTGKELVARALHALSPRSSGAFHVLRCASMPTALLEGELLAHARGDVRGATGEAASKRLRAPGGTLLLDEVGNLSLDAQTKLVSILESRSAVPAGRRGMSQSGVRIIASTHRPLRKEVEAGRFRADLLHRLKSFPLFLPPLRTRPADILLIADKVLEELSARSRRKVVRLGADARAALEQYSWPGNVRELRSALEYALVAGDGPVLNLSELPLHVANPASPFDGELRVDHRVAPPDAPRDASSSPEAARILRALERASGNKARAAQALGLSRVTLWRRMKELGI